MAKKEKSKWEYGDFQTPLVLADAAVAALTRSQVRPQTVLEPTCGRGAFLLAAQRAFPHAKHHIGLDINQQYLTELDCQASSKEATKKLRLIAGDFFRFDWHGLLEGLPDPILIVGNPPWVTSSELGLLLSDNLPIKSNFQARRGVDAITGKSNFDISEWMLLEQLDWLKGRRGVIAVLCKTAVARKILLHGWKNKLLISSSAMFGVDAKKHFNASVDACFLVIEMLGEAGATDCAIYDDLGSPQPCQVVGYHDEIVVSNVAYYCKWRHLRGANDAYVWRSGIKHDCSSVMELEADGENYRNGTGEVIDLEDEYVYPMLKSSDISNGEIRYGRKYMVVTQRYVGEDTGFIRRRAPRTWRYLEEHDEQMNKRASSIYRNRPKYSIFGVGDYSFSAWKVAISGFYKRLSFKLIEPYNGKTVVLDDTTNFLPCWSESEAQFILDLLTSTPAQEFFEGMIFWADKRPITVEILKRLDLHALSVELGRESEYLRFARRRGDLAHEEIQGQLSFGVAEKKANYSVHRKTTSNTSIPRRGRKTTRRPVIA